MKLAEIYQEIDKLEKSKINVKEFSRRSEEFMPYALAGLLLLIASVFLKTTLFRNIP
jgi:Ca-activated chloride channel family protein